MSDAICRTHEEKPIMFHHRQVRDFADDYASVIRMGLSKLRDFKSETLLCSRGEKKARTLFI